MTGSLQQTLEGHTDAVISVAFSHDSKLLASASYDQTSKSGTPRRARCSRRSRAIPTRASSVAFSHDSKLLASASDDQTVKVWDAATGSLQQTLEGHTDAVSSVAFSDHQQTYNNQLRVERRADPDWARLTELSPRVHQRSPLLQRVAAPIGLLGFVADDVSERSFGQFAREIRLVARPIAEGRTKPVNRDPIGLHSAQEHSTMAILGQRFVGLSEIRTRQCCPERDAQVFASRDLQAELFIDGTNTLASSRLVLGYRLA